jgi:putative membrane protein
MSKMSDNPYKKFSRDKLILRDFLAADRTVLANERTFLAYVRTALALIILGITAWHFLETDFYKIIGIISIALGFLVFIIGIVHYQRMNKKIAKLK